MDPQEFVDDLNDKKWIAVGALIIGFIVRLLKSDTKIPITIPPEWRPLVALALGGVAIVLEHVASGGSWIKSIEFGVLSSVLSICGHDLLIENARKGKELPVPGMMKKGTS